MSDATQPHVLPLFPLENVVLFPHGQVPLHVFEPRYRELTQVALATDRSIGMVAVRPEGVDAMAGDPPIFAVGCEGTILEAHRRADGRYDLLLEGTRRFRILQELSRDGARLHRRALVEPLPDPIAAGDGPRLHALRMRTIELLGELLRHLTPQRGASLEPSRFSGIDDATFVNVLSQLLGLPTAEKQGLLEADGLVERCDRLATLLRFRVAELGGGVSSASRSFH